MSTTRHLCLIDAHRQNTATVIGLRLVFVLAKAVAKSRTHRTSVGHFKQQPLQGDVPVPARTASTASRMIISLQVAIYRCLSPVVNCRVLSHSASWLANDRYGAVWRVSGVWAEGLTSSGPCSRCSAVSFFECYMPAAGVAPPAAAAPPPAAATTAVCVAAEWPVQTDPRGRHRAAPTNRKPAVCHRRISFNARNARLLIYNW